MKHLETLFNLLLFPFLFIGAYLGKLFTFQTESKGYRYHLTPFTAFTFLFAFNIAGTTTLNADSCYWPTSVTLNTSSVAVETGHLEDGGGRRDNKDDYYTFTAPENGWVTIVTKDYSGNMYGYLYDDSGCTNVVKSDERDDKENINLSFNVSKNQTYKIKLLANSGDDSDYKLRLYYPNADLKIEKSVSNTNPSINNTIIYTLKGTNLGNKKSKIKILDTIPPELQVLSVSLTHSPDPTLFSCTHSGNNVTATGTYKFDTNDYAKCTITAKVLSSGSPITNTATISSPNHRYDPDTSNNTHSVDINVAASNQRPTADAGDDQTVDEGDTVTLDGSGSTDVDGTITNYKWTEGTTTLYDGSLSSFDKSDFTAGTHTITLEVTDNGGETDTDTVDITVNAVTSTVEISKTVSDTTPEAGETVTFTITTTNKGADKRIEFRDGFPTDAAGESTWSSTANAFENVTFSAPSGVTCSWEENDGPYIYCVTDSAYAHNESFTVTVDAKVKKVGHLCNTAHGYEHYWDWKSSAEVCVDATLGDNADLRVLQNGAPTPDPVGTGEDATFKLRTQNGGPDTSEHDIVLKVSYSQDVTITSVTEGSGFSCNTTSGALSSGTFITCTKTSDWTSTSDNIDFEFVVQPSTDGTLTQTATIESTVTYDPDTSNNELTLSVNVESGDIVENADDICYEDLTYEVREIMGIPAGACVNIGLVQGGINCQQNIPLKNQNLNHDLSDVQIALDTSMFSGSFFGDCGVDNGEGSESCQQNQSINFGPAGMFNDNVTYDLDNMPVGDKDTLWEYALMAMSMFEGDNIYASYIKDGVRHKGQVKACQPAYCETENLPEGFHIIDPDEGDNQNSFEIFCYEDDVYGEMHDMLALPIKNNSNNFVFDSETTSYNYYDTTANPRTHFHAVEVNINQTVYSGTFDNGEPKPYFPVLALDREVYSITTDGSNYNVMGQDISNINLIGTPFEIDWGTDTELEECDTSKLRKALNQAVKYDTLTNDGDSICHINKMTISLQQEYRYLTYLDNEVLEASCKAMAESIPNNVGVLDDAAVAGYFNIDPFGNGRGGADIGAKERPITVWCKYQEDLKWVWTFLTALDAKKTVSKTDLTSKQDTCSELGLYFYVPNTKETFNRVRLYLKGQKTGDAGWENYTGTINEKIHSHVGSNNYYLSAFQDVLIWPYGPMGVYFPLNGNKKADGTTADWGDGANTARGWMSGSAMNNSDSDSLGGKGWVSILGEQDLNKTNEWWIADIGAGEEIGKATPNSNYSPQGTHPIQSTNYVYYEPNGNYTHEAWLNFLFDSEGWVYHNDDWNNNYPYYDYLCMSETNYDIVTRYALVPGFFNAIERSTRSGNTPPNFSDDDLTTKIVNKNIQLDIILYKYDTTTGIIDINSLEEDEDKSVGVFLAKGDEAGNLQILKYLDELEDFDSNNGRIQLPNFTSSSAQKETFLHFFYCNPAGEDWKTCWDYNGNANSPTVAAIAGEDGGESDSYDMFAIRPNNFAISTDLLAGSTTSYKGVSGADFNITFRANDYSGNPTNNYNENNGSSELSFNVGINEVLSGCLTGNFNQEIGSGWDFSDGIKTLDTRYSEVGAVNIIIQENNMNDFAHVDVNDTADADRLITEANISIAFIPDHFKIDAVLTDHKAGQFTYLSKDLNMSSKLNISITAKNKQNSTTENYNSLCYAKPIDTNLSVVYNPTLFSPNNLDKILYYLDANNSTYTKEGNSSNINSIIFSNIPISVFPSGDNNGTAKLKIKFNFDRKRNEPVNPFDMNITNVNITDTDNVNGADIPGTNATYLFARAKASKDLYDDVTATNISTPIMVQIYCDRWPASSTKCPKIDIINGPTIDNRWWISTSHNMVNNDGNITLTVGSASGTLNTPNVSINTGNNGIDNNINVSYPPGSTRPYTVEIDLDTTNPTDTNSWVIYNPASDISDPDPFYKVRFIGKMGWAGFGKTGNVVDNNSSTKKNQRMEW